MALGVMISSIAASVRTTTGSSNGALKSVIANAGEIVSYILTTISKVFTFLGKNVLLFVGLIILAMISYIGEKVKKRD